MTRPFKIAMLLAAAAALTACEERSTPADNGVRDTASNQWLQDASSDALRFERLEYYLGGFSSAMWETGERWERIHEALAADNPDLALYHWKKIRDAIERGAMKRPGRKANAEALFLDSTWGEVAERFASGNTETAWNGFAQARSACMACHAAEEVAYMNAQPLFTELQAPSVD